MEFFKIIEADVMAEGRGYRVFAQAILGEILSSPNGDALRSINSKRVDILIVDQDAWPVVAVEYQGAGHYQGTAAARDAVKKEALRKAGVRYVAKSAKARPPMPQGPADMPGTVLPQTNLLVWQISRSSTAPAA